MNHLSSPVATNTACDMWKLLTFVPRTVFLFVSSLCLKDLFKLFVLWPFYCWLIWLAVDQTPIPKVAMWYEGVFKASVGTFFSEAKVHGPPKVVMSRFNSCMALHSDSNFNTALCSIYLLPIS